MIYIAPILTYRPWPRPQCVRWGSVSPKGSQTQFSAHVCCGQTAGWIKMPLGTKVGLGSGHTVLDGDPAPPKGVQHPDFLAHVYCGQTPNGWMNQDATWYGSRPRPRPHCVRWGPSSPKGYNTPTFRPMPIVAKRSPISATVLLSSCYFLT